MNDPKKDRILVYRGQVLKGAQEGRTLGFPTANVAFMGSKMTGTYAAEVTLAHETFRAAVYVNERRKLLEAHILDFSRDIYGQEITMTLLKKVAETEVFTDVNALQKKIARDVALVKKYFVH